MNTKAWIVPALAAALSACGGSDSSPLKAGDLDCGVPAAPGGLRGNPGPGPAQASLTWAPAAANGGADVERYRVYRDGQPFARLGNTLAFGDTGAIGSHGYEVSAINACGVEGPRSAAVSVVALPGALVEAPVTPSSVASAKLNSYKVLDASGEEIGTRTWRTVKGLGNCCETYVATDANGRLYEYGGSNLYFSDDQGASWSMVSNIVPTLGAEGAIVGAPGGDMLAVNWDPYTGDQVWAHKYVAATGTWYTARTPVHAPFHDRPWVAVVEGPFDVQGTIVPYVSFVMSNYVHGDILMMSLDGLHYVVPNPRVLAETQVPVALGFPADPDRDWNQAMVETSFYPLDGGAGLRDRADLSNNCAHALLTPAIEWACPEWAPEVQAPQAGDVVRVDSAGAIHVTTAGIGMNFFTHRVSTDAGRTWRSVRARIPGGRGIENWDLQVNAALDQVVVAVHASRGAAEPDQDMVFRFTDIHGDIALKEILLVGNGDQVFGSGLGAAVRFDYTTVALLPDGRVALSFGDKRHNPPALAVEVGN